MICYNCGKTFHANELVRVVDTETGPAYCCPYCGCDDTADTEDCSICGGSFVDGEIVSGFCLSCLWSEINYDVALAYMTKGREPRLAEFLLNDWFGANLNGCISDALTAHLTETFRRLEADEKLRCATSKAEQPRFLEACRSFCLPDYYNGGFGVEGTEFAEWYAKEVEKK